MHITKYTLCLLFFVSITQLVNAQDEFGDSLERVTFWQHYPKDADGCDYKLMQKWKQYKKDFYIYTEPDIVYDFSDCGCPLAWVPGIWKEYGYEIDYNGNNFHIENERFTSEGWLKKIIHFFDRPYGTDSLHPERAHGDRAILANTDRKTYQKDFYNWSYFLQTMNKQIKLAQTYWNLEHLRFSNDGGAVPNFYNIAKSNLVYPEPIEDFDHHGRYIEHAQTFFSAPWDDQFSGICSLDPLAHTYTQAAAEPNDCVLCDAFYRATPLERAVALIHESRHRKPWDPKHVGCPVESIYGSSASNSNSIKDECDRRLEANPDKQGSGYNMDVYFLYWVAFKQMSNIFDKQEAIRLLKDRLYNRFIEKPTDEQLRKYLEGN